MTRLHSETHCRHSWHHTRCALQGANVTQELPAKAKQVSAKGDDNKGEPAIGLHYHACYGVPPDFELDCKM